MGAPPFTGTLFLSRYTDANSCTAVGLKLAVARTKAHMTAMYAKYGAGSFTPVPGVYGINGGMNSTGCIMNSTDNTCNKNWVAIDGGAWWARDAAYTEPNGDYQAGCWLGMTDTPHGNGDLQLNDANCNYSPGSSYICSDNAK